MGFMGVFGGKKTSGGETGDWGSDQVGMMKMLAGMPHMMRKPMMKGRINQLLSLTEEKRQESIRDMIGAFNSPQVKPKARESLVATRVEILGELPEEKRRTIISSRTTLPRVGSSRPAGPGAGYASGISEGTERVPGDLATSYEEQGQLGISFRPASR